jgi:hypothetical protein
MGEGKFEPFSLAVCVGTDFETVVEIRATYPSEGAGESPAGISSAVVSRTRTPDPYARINRSPVQDLVPTLLLNAWTRGMRVHKQKLPVVKIWVTSPFKRVVAGSNPAADTDIPGWFETRGPSSATADSGFRLRANTPAKRLKFESCRRMNVPA